MSYAEADLRGPLALVVGSEGRGISASVRRRVDLSVRIPMRGKIGSLNAAVAGSILLFAVAQQRPIASIEPAPTPDEPAPHDEPAPPDKPDKPGKAAKPAKASNAARRPSPRRPPPRRRPRNPPSQTTNYCPKTRDEQTDDFCGRPRRASRKQ